MRRLIVRLRNADDVSTLSKRVGVDLTSVTSLEWVRGIPDLFGDTLNIRFLKAGYCTLNFQMFLGDKTTTQRCSGGNTDTVYVDGDRRLKFA